MNTKVNPAKNITENVAKWLDFLHTTDVPQSEGYLRNYINADEFGYCCLGIATLMCPTMSDKAKEAAFQTQTLMPYPALNWLGVTSEDGSTPVDGVWDLVLDTADMRPAREWTAAEWTAASLNDQGFSFGQIADMICYFGIKAAV